MRKFFVSYSWTSSSFNGFGNTSCAFEGPLTGERVRQCEADIQQKQEKKKSMRDVRIVILNIVPLEE